MSANHSKITSCKECGSTDLSWNTHNQIHNAIQQGRLNTSDVTCVFVLGCNQCSETLAVVNAEKVACSMNATPKPAPTNSVQNMLHWALGELLGALPERRDWLNPDAEKVLRATRASLAIPISATGETDREVALRFKREADALWKRDYEEAAASHRALVDALRGLLYERAGRWYTGTQGDADVTNDFAPEVLASLARSAT